MDWQPIATAPKDGTIVLLLLDGEQPFVGRWFAGETYEFGKLKRKNEGWTTHTTSVFQKPNFTHWMPIPPLDPGA